MSEPKGKRRLAAIAATDMVGYSRLMELDEAGTLARQKAIEKEVFAPAVAECNGRVVKTTGDGALIEFDSAVNAVRWAALVQRKIAERERETPGESRVAYRIGINIGDILVDGDDIFGEGVNVAARLEALAEHGGILVSEALFRNVRGKLDLGFADLGKLSVKNISEPVHAYSVLLDPLDAGRVVSREAAPRARTRLTLIASVVFLVAIGVFAARDLFKNSAPDAAGLLISPFVSEGGADPVLADAATEMMFRSFERQRQLPIATYSTALAYEGIDVSLDEVSRDLGIRYVVDGSVEETGDQIEVKARVRDAAAAGDATLWERSTTGDRDQLLDMLVSLKLGAAGALKLKLNPIERAIFESRPTNNPEAYFAFARAERLLDSKEFTDIGDALVFYEEAINLDPDFVEAKLGYAEANFQIWKGSFNTLRFTLDALRIATELVEEVLKDDPGNPKALALQVRMLIQHLARDRALSLARSSVFRNPDDPDLRYVHGLSLTTVGDYDKAVEAFGEYERLSPRLNSGEKGDLAWSYLRAGKSQKALALLSSIPDDEMREQHFRILADTQYQTGNIEAARANIERFLNNNVWLNLAWMKPWFEIYEDTVVYQKFAEAMLGSGLPEWPFDADKGREGDRIGHEQLVFLHSSAFEERHTIGPFGAPYSEDRMPNGQIAMNFGWMNGIPLTGTWQITGDQVCRRLPSVHQGRELCHYLYLDRVRSTDETLFVSAVLNFGVMESEFVRMQD
jgi:adenylate cyclase